VTLLVEEMRRVLWFFWWRRTSWLEKGQECGHVREDLKEGLAGYAAKQAAILEGLGEQFANEWYLTLVSHGLDTEWPRRYLEKWSGIDLDLEKVRRSEEKKYGAEDEEGEDDELM
jgi:hypothetical protein